MQKNISENMVILLTATVDVNGCPKLKRSDPELRKNDHKEALKLWLENTNCKFVLCENSNYDLSFLNEVLDTQEKRDRVELISYDGNKNIKSVGKGYGEFDTVEYAVDNSEFIKNFTHVLKVTGRYYCSRLVESLLAVDYSKFDLIVHERKISPMHKQKCANTLFWGASKEFYQSSIQPKKSKINDPGGVWAEHILLRIWNATPENQKVKFNNLGATGWSGTAGHILHWSDTED